MLVKGIIKNDVYVKLIEYAFKKNDAVMFVARQDGFNTKQVENLKLTVNKVKSLFQKQALKYRNGGQWVFTSVGNKRCGDDEDDPIGYDDLFEVMFFKTDNELKNYMLSNRDLYKWLNPNYLEDVSFFKNGYCWLYSVAHEDLCVIFCESEEEYNYLRSIGIVFWEEEFTPISKEEVYYEEYS